MQTGLLRNLFNSYVERRELQNYFQFCRRACMHATHQSRRRMQVSEISSGAVSLKLVRLSISTPWLHFDYRSYNHCVHPPNGTWLQNLPARYLRIIRAFVVLTHIVLFLMRYLTSLVNVISLPLSVVVLRTGRDCFLMKIMIVIFDELALGSTWLYTPFAIFKSLNTLSQITVLN